MNSAKNQNIRILIIMAIVFLALNLACKKEQGNEEQANERQTEDISVADAVVTGPTISTLELAENLMTLPFDQDKLAPSISPKTLYYHYGKHHNGYVNKLANAVKGTEFEKMELKKIITETYNDPDNYNIFKNAAQVFNHEFYWKSLKPTGGGQPDNETLEIINENFESYAAFREKIKQAGGVFGSGWIWVIYEDGKLKVTSTSNAVNPIALGQIPILTIDVWEHAYYLDYQNARSDYIDSVLDGIINWNFLKENYKNAKEG